MSFFEVDKEGLAKLAERRGKAFVLYELLQNAWDTDATEVRVSLDTVALLPEAVLQVEDDHPDGFKNLAHAWTLFAESEKKGDAEKRGRFNLGEKLVLALCREAEIITTTGGVRFDHSGRHTLRRKRAKGSLFRATIRMTRAELEECCAAVQKVIVPANVRTIFNGEELESRRPIEIETITVKLPTEIADEEGYLRRRVRQTKLHVYRLRSGEVGSLYEMGIPVMETGDPYHVDVLQKVPLNMERDGVPPSYLRAVRAATLNAVWQELNTPEEASAAWVRDAMASPDVGKDAVEGIVYSRFGTDRVIFDPSDPEANNIAMSKGMTVIPGAAMSAEEWQNVRRFEAAKPAGQVTPSPKPFSPGGERLKMLAAADFTEQVMAVERFARALGEHLLGEAVEVDWADDRGWGFRATYGSCRLILNYGDRSLRAAVDRGRVEPLLELLIHEFAHHYEKNHLAEGFHEACCRLGAKLAMLALERPEMVRL